MTIKKIKVIEDITVNVVEVLCFNAFYCMQFTYLADELIFRIFFLWQEMKLPPAVMPPAPQGR